MAGIIVIICALWLGILFPWLFIVYIAIAAMALFSR